MGRHLVRTLAWKALLYLVVAVVVGGLTRDLMLTALLTLGFAAGDSSVAVLLRTPILRGDAAADPVDAADPVSPPQVSSPKQSSTP